MRTTCTACCREDEVDRRVRFALEGEHHRDFALSQTQGIAKEGYRRASARHARPIWVYNDLDR